MSRPTALVTGASSGIGERIALRLASSGHDLVLVARRGVELERVASAAAGLGAACEIVSADLSDAADVARVVDRIRDAARPIEVVVNNAGYGRFGKLLELDAAGEANEIAVNVTALTLISQAALASMAPRGRGAILNVASLASFIPFPGFTTYAATKAYVRHFTLALHEEAKPLGILLTSADTVARIALEALAAGRALVVPGWINAASARLLSIVPSFLLRRMGSIGARVPR